MTTYESRALRIATLVASAALACALSAPDHASASPLFEAVGGEHGGGANARFSRPSVSSTYFSPALLTRIERNTFSLGVLTMQDAVSLTLYGRTGVDVPISLLDSYNADLSGFTDPSFPTTWLEDGCEPVGAGRCNRSLAPNPRQAAGTSGGVHAYASAGVVIPLIERRLVFGLHALIPIGSFTGGDQFFVDEREQFFSNSLHPELLGDRLSAPSVSFAVASEFFDSLSVGLGIEIRMNTTAVAETFAADANDLSSSLELSTAIDVSIGVAPYGSVSYAFGDGSASLTATVHSPSRFEVGVGLTTILPDGDNQRTKRTATLDYMPWQFGFGGSVTVFDRGDRVVSLTGGVNYSLWSNYVDRQSNRPSGAYAWSNTVSPSLGAHLADGLWEAGVDLNYVPSPVPLQTGRTNYVDNHRGGIGAHISRGFTASGVDLRVGVTGRVNRLFHRAQRKTVPDTSGEQDRSLVIDELPDTAIDNRRQEPVPDALGLQTNNPGWPGFESSGWLWNAGLTLEVSF